MLEGGVVCGGAAAGGLAGDRDAVTVSLAGIPPQLEVAKLRPNTQLIVCSHGNFTLTKSCLCHRIYGQFIESVSTALTGHT